MSKRTIALRRRSISVAVAAALGIAVGGASQAFESTHQFSIDDIQGAFTGSTYGAAGAVTDPSIICGLGVTCPTDVLPIVDKQGVTLYPIDSEFGFYIVDFLGAAQKYRDDNYLEGYVNNFTDGVGGGIKVSNQATDTYKVKPPFGTWCRGLGGNSVKCETEHYTVMEHVLSCHEVIPYLYADPVLGTQEVQDFADLIPADYPNVPPYELPAQSSFDCALAGLDDAQYVVQGGVVTDILLTSNASVVNGGQMDANDLTTVLDNYSVSNDYTITLKDDGKPDYHWGTLIKRPNDIRMYARFDVPPEWTAPDAPAAGYTVTKAYLYVTHWITNNPNDQLRPEDIENEAATGRKPSYRIDPADPASPDPAATVWKSTVPCYEGDADVIDTEEGGQDPTFVGVGTYLKNTPWGYTGVQPADPCAPGDNCYDPQPLSADLTGGFTNAYYTTINRDPFEWSYRDTRDPTDVFNFVGCNGPIDATPAPTCTVYIFDGTATATVTVPEPDFQYLTLVSGPRWRLKANKFGQDLPGLEIPAAECSPPPFERDNIKYNVGDLTTTVVNLLDWDTANKGPSPLSNSLGWIDTTVVPSADGLECTLAHNPFITIINADPAAGCVLPDGVRPITSNGLPMSDGFDLAVYVKGDKKSTAIYSARLVIAYEGEVVPPPVVDVALSSLVSVPPRVPGSTTASIVATVTNIGPDTTTTCDVEVTGLSNRGVTYGPYTGGCANLPAGVSQSFTFPWTAPTRPGNVDWTATVTAAGDTNPDNDTATVKAQISP